MNIESPKAWKVLPKSLAEPEVVEMLERAGLAASHPQARATALRDRAILELLYAGGLRVSEVTALSTGDLGLDMGRVQVRGKGDWKLWSAICARAGRIWRALARGEEGMRPGKTRHGCFSRCEACR